MTGEQAFEDHHRRYDAWFERHGLAYQSELLAVRALMPWRGLGLSIGVGTGRFAAPLGVAMGIDPVASVLAYAARRGIKVVQGAGESLPFATAVFDYALIVTTICFADDAGLMLAEAMRVLKPGGQLVIGFIDRDSGLGQEYLSHQEDNIFYRDATFFSTSEVDRLLSRTGFTGRLWIQTLTGPVDEMREIEPASGGFGRGAFVVVRGTRP